MHLRTGDENLRRTLGESRMWYFLYKLSPKRNRQRNVTRQSYGLIIDRASSRAARFLKNEEESYELIVAKKLKGNKIVSDIKPVAVRDCLPNLRCHHEVPGNLSTL